MIRTQIPVTENAMVVNKTKTMQRRAAAMFAMEPPKVSRAIDNIFPGSNHVRNLGAMERHCAKPCQDNPQCIGFFLEPCDTAACCTLLTHSSLFQFTWDFTWQSQ